MKRFSHILSLILAGVLCLSLAACGTKAPESAAVPTLPPTPSPTPHLANAPVLEVCAEDDGTVRLSWQGDDTLYYKVTRILEPHPQEVSLGTFAPGDAMDLVDLLKQDDFICTYRVYPFESEADISAGNISGPIGEIRLQHGFFYTDGYLFCFENNVPVIQRDIGHISFNSDGYYSSGDEELDGIIRGLIAEHTTDDMSRMERFEAVYDYIVDNFEYGASRFIEDNAEPGSWEVESAKKFLQNGYGNCFSYAAAVAMVGRALGFDAYTMIGDCRTLMEWVDHGWCQVDLHGTSYVCDAEMESAYCPSRGLDWDLFMKPRGTTPTIYDYERDVYW